jgi:DNA polymerase III gamma/tau subunit
MLYHTYRPISWDQVKGNEDILSSLQTMLGKPNPPHAYLLHGPTGTGKTTIGRIIAKELDCNENDLKEIDSGQFRGIDTVREIRTNSSYLPLEGKNRCWIIDEAQKLTSDAMSALLKILEDTPKHCYFILCTTEPQKILPAIRGRCIELQTKLLDDEQLTSLLRKVVRSEGETLQKEVYEQIVQDSLGHPRNALNILEQVLSSPVENRLNVAHKSAEEQTQSIELCRKLIQGARWKEISFILNGLKNQEPESIRRLVLGYCQSILLKEDNMRAGLIMEEMYEPFYNTGFPGLVFRCYSIVKGE